MIRKILKFCFVWILSGIFIDRVRDRRVLFKHQFYFANFYDFFILAVYPALAFISYIF